MAYRTFTYAVGDAWVIGMYGTRAVYTIKKAEYRARDRKEIYTVDVDGHEMKCTKNRLHYLLNLGTFKKIKRGNYTKYKISEPPEKIIRAYYAYLRDREELRAETLNDKLESSELYSRIKSEIARLSMELAKAEYARKDIATLVRLKGELSAAKTERLAILETLGITPKELKKKPQCGKCGDYGYINGKACECVERHMPEIMEYWEKSDEEKQRGNPVR